MSNEFEKGTPENPYTEEEAVALGIDVEKVKEEAEIVDTPPSEEENPDQGVVI